MGFRHTLVTVIVIVGHLASGRPESDANGDRFRSYQRQFLRGFADVERLQVDPIIDDALTHLHRNWLHHRPPPRVFRISFGIPVSFIQRSRVRFNPTRDRPIGVGSFGTVYKASLDGVVPVAVKFFNNHTAMADSIHEFRNELRGSYLTVGLPNVAPFVGFIVDRTLGPGIVTRFGEGGTVSQFLERNKFIPAHIRLRLAAELCTGVAGMHARNVVHGDINPKNVVIGFPNGVVGKFEVWIIDLSSARALSAQYIPNMMT